MPLDFWKDIAIIFGGIVALLTLLTALVEFFRQGQQVRASRFLEMRRRFLESPLFRDILNLLHGDQAELSQIPIQDRRNFAGFFEEIALMVNSKLISRSVAFYMFGDYVILTARSEHFWTGLDRNSLYWSVFRDFAETMERVQKDGSQLSKIPRF